MQRRFISTVLLGVGCLFAGLPALSQSPPMTESRKIAPTDGAANDRFGSALSINGGRALIGALFDDDKAEDAGSVHLVDPLTGAQIRQILATDRTRELSGHQDDLFGHAVDLRGNLAVVGAVNSSEAASLAGAVYVLDLATGKERAKLLPFTFRRELPSFQSFGFDVALSESHIVVGAPGDVQRGSGAGAIYLYDAVSLSLVAKAFANDAGFADNLGRSVAIWGTIAIASVPFDDDLGTDAGAVYVFDATTGRQLHKLLPEDGQAQQFFGLSIAIDDGIVVVGAPFDDEIGNNAGAVYLFDVQTGRQLAKLVAQDGAAGDQFGFSVAIEGQRVVVGSPLDDDGAADSGSVYVFDRVTGEQVASLRASDAAPSDALGYTVAVSGATVMAGAFRDERGIDSGAVYVFQLDGAPGGGETVSVAAIDAATVEAGRNRERAQVSITVRDQLGAPVQGAIVLAQLSGDINELVSATTGDDGAATFLSRQSRRAPLRYEVCVLDVSATLRYDPDANVETCDMP